MYENKFEYLTLENKISVFVKGKPNIKILFNIS